MQPPIYVINLDKSHQRFTNTQARFADVGCTVTRLPGVLGTALTDAEVDALYSVRRNQTMYFRSLSRGEIGCYASHRNAWELIANSEQPFGIVVEDDILVEARFPQALETLQNLPFAWDMIKLANYQDSKRTVAFSHPLTETFDITITRKTITGCAGYAVSRDCAKKLLDSTKLFARPVDTDLQHFWEHDIHIYNLTPFCIKQDMSYDSDIGKTRKASGKRKWQKVKLQILNFPRNITATKIAINALKQKLAKR